ncbi:MAG: bifunctional adenosylcobinamide kinase/adenosylcobinamide-phosphate guanylyltransferase [Hylemonella sp.]|uniref:bifunctional adenosylcobinamide kinase/adenosylcobinamide-phosphate guanylyltransferase n=1 Tax=Hylemonella sp. TaxID=2066020 RepID=UPI0022C0DFEC|nr:bifunctional adenosylcobinamide kinase/adenosylcobinamide-phosphate guanylyltransferase [Hylemonella sp.]MCZ8251335.1 bifunctional adenosylcobinamide kinase/adenosylcobinamide-phosphate guanylyltransferase [Hylemonella sp.]
MDVELTVAPRELILGGQRSGKSRRAELLARVWLAQSSQNRAVLIATGQPHDTEMRERIARHQRDRAERVPGLGTIEEPLHLDRAITEHSTPATLLVVDCLTLWLTNHLMPADGTASEPPIEALLLALRAAAGPVVLVGNEIGLGVIPMGREVRHFVDALGRLNQEVAAICERVSFMAAGLPLTLKGHA